MKIKTILGTYHSNTYVCDFGKQILIIDSGAEPSAVQTAVGDKPVAAILVTHEHFDHLTNCVAYAKLFHAPIYGAREVLDNLKYYKPELPSEDENELGVIYPIVVYDPAVKFHTIADETPLEIAGIMVKPYICQGHSAGSVVYQIGDCIFTGDLLFKRGTGFLYMTNGKRYMVESLQRVQQLKFTLAYHGHGEPSTFEEQRRNLQVWLKWLTR